MNVPHLSAAATREQNDSPVSRRARERLAAQTRRPFTTSGVADRGHLIRAPGDIDGSRRHVGGDGLAVGVLQRQNEGLFRIGHADREPPGIRQGPRRERPPHHVVNAQAEHRRELAVGVNDAIGVQQHDAVAVRFGQLAELLAARLGAFVA